jgi:glycosyltransferase involved in cell wall biosynthesis
MTPINQSLPVSVIIPVHNRFYFVDEAVQSVFDQTHRPIELILVDDYSDTPYIPKISSRPGFEVKFFRHEENKGPGASRETGRQAARGDFFAYLDSDDLWHPQKLEKQVAMLQAHPEAGMCYCQSVEFSSLPLTGDEPLRRQNEKAFTTFLPTILRGRPWGTGACLWTRGATDRIGPWSDGWTWEDYEYDCRAGCLDIPISFIPEILCYFRSNYGENQLSATNGTMCLIHKAKSLQLISSSLNIYGKIHNREIAQRFQKILHNNAMYLFFAGEKLIARELLVEATKITSMNHAIVYLLLISVCLWLPYKFCGSLLYKFRRVFVED